MAKMPAPPRPNPPSKPGLYEQSSITPRKEDVPGWNTYSIEQLSDSEYSVRFCGYELRYKTEVQAKSLLLEASSKIEDCNSLDEFHSISKIRMGKVITFMTFLNDVAVQERPSAEHLMRTLLALSEHMENLQAAFIAELRKKCSLTNQSKEGK